MALETRMLFTHNLQHNEFLDGSIHHRFHLFGIGNVQSALVTNFAARASTSSLSTSAMTTNLLLFSRKSLHRVTDRYLTTGWGNNHLTDKCIDHKTS